MLAAGALHHPPFGGIVERDMLMKRHARLYGRVDPSAYAAGLALPEREHDAVTGEEAGIIVRLSLRRVAGFHRRVATDIAQTAHSITDNIRRFVMRVGSV